MCVYACVCIVHVHVCIHICLYVCTYVFMHLCVIYSSLYVCVRHALNAYFQKTSEQNRSNKAVGMGYLAS